MHRAPVKDGRPKTNADRREISIEHRREIESWCRALDCTEAELRAALRAVGRSTAEVRVFLERQ